MIKVKKVCSQKKKRCTGQEIEKDYRQQQPPDNGQPPVANQYANWR